MKPSKPTTKKPTKKSKTKPIAPKRQNPTLLRNTDMAEKKKRDYVKERLNESPDRRKKRAIRNNARREAIREGKAKVGDGTVVNHKRPLSKGGTNSKANREMQSRKASNREGGKLQPKSGKAKGGRN